MKQTKKGKVLERVCPNCYQSKCVQVDMIHAEYYCKYCGLVLRGPPTCGIIYPGLITPPTEEDKKKRNLTCTPPNKF